MRRHVLCQTNLEVSQLGFGCVQLTAHADRRDAVRVLEEAFAQGVTHFDVARAYGFGRAEGILGEFLRSKRQQVTVATKFGIEPPLGLAGNRWMIDLAKRFLGPFPRLLERARQCGSAMMHSGVFTPPAAIQSLETSLREMGTDYVDLLLLHEASVSDACNSELFDALQQQISRGTVRSIGVAAAFQKVAYAEASLPAAYKVLQFEDNARARNLRTLSRSLATAVITHSIFKPASSLLNAVGEQSALVDTFSSEIGVDLRQRETIGSLLLHYALASNPDGVVLFSSSNASRVSANVRDADSARYDERQLSRFVEFVDAALSPGSGSTNVHLPTQRGAL